MQANDAPVKEQALSALYYATCSSLAIVANKIAITKVPIPGFIFSLQLLVTVGFIFSGRAANQIDVDELSFANCRRFIPYICSFVISLYSNGRALAASNIETIIVFRACSPLCVSFLDWFFLGRELPNWKSLLSLLGVVMGATGYVLCDSQFKVNGMSAYGWVFCNFCGIVFEMTYGKRLVSNVTFRSPVWGATLYTNALAIAPMMVVAISTNEPQRLFAITLEQLNDGLIWLLLSCVIGVGISWSGWNCRSKISATAYTLLGVVCKFVSVLINVLIWDKHATPAGLCWLGVCLASSATYRQAPMRTDVSSKPEQSADSAETIGITNHETESEGRANEAGSGEDRDSGDDAYPRKTTASH